MKARRFPIKRGVDEGFQLEFRIWLRYEDRLTLKLIDAYQEVMRMSV